MNGSFFEGDLKIRGRRINGFDIDEIRQVVSEYGLYSRTRISRELCGRWQWRQSNGSLKERACLDILNEMERRGLIVLPPRQKGVLRKPPLSAGVDGDQVINLGLQVWNIKIKFI